MLKETSILNISDTVQGN